MLKGVWNMADVKTNLRELSVVLGLRNHTINEIRKISPVKFYDFVNTYVSNDISSAVNIRSLTHFNSDHMSIIENGIKLGLEIRKSGIINEQLNIRWLGFDSQKDDPVDLIIGNVGFSLKEESFILENMGLYKYLNLLTNSNYYRGLHVFEEFSPKEYREWFNYTWRKLIEQCKKSNWSFNDNGRIQRISVSNDKVIFSSDNHILAKLPLTPGSPSNLMKLTDSYIREKIFSKWINIVLKEDEEYARLKKFCSETAGRNLTKYVNDNLNISGISRLLQIYNQSYYYAKTTSAGVEIYCVPSQKEFNNVYRINKVTYSVPLSQLNILTTIENTRTKKKLTLRNECRFSHGQFNGTPEAKMYYENGSDLSVIYIKL
jgi:hypothetical protein